MYGVFRCIVSVSAAVLLVAVSSEAQSIDNAGNYNVNGWIAGSNRGQGFGAWSFNNTSTNGTFNREFLATSTLNGTSVHPGINSSNSVAFGMYADNGAAAIATRPFAAALQLGSTFSINFENGNIASSGDVGFSLQDAAGQDRISFFFRGGSSQYTLATASTVTNGLNTGIGYTDTGLHIAFTLTGADTMNVSVSGMNGNSSSVSVVGFALGGITGSAITQISLFDDNAGFGSANYDFYNDLSITGGPVTPVPEPSTMAVAGVAVACLLVIQRRNARRHAHAKA